jgi:hypothetical protein
MARRGHNEGTIYRETDGRWIAAIDLGRVGGSANGGKSAARREPKWHEI